MLYFHMGYSDFWGVFWLCHLACGILVPQSGTEAGAVAVEEQSPNHWTTGNFLIVFFKIKKDIPKCKNCTIGLKCC